MSSATNQVGMLMSITGQSTAATNVSALNQKAGEKAAAGFDSILSQITENVTMQRTNEAQKTLGQVKAVVSDNGNNAADNTKTDQIIADTTKVEIKDQTVVTDNNAAKTETVGKESAGELQEAINEDGKELITQISEELDVTEEEVIQAMQVLGLMAADLLNPQNIQQVVTAVLGEEQTADLITDSDIYTSLQDLMEGAESMKSELMNEFDLSDEEFEAAIADTAKNFKDVLEEGISDITEEIPETAEFVKADSQTAKVKAPQSEAITEEAPKDEPVVKVVAEGSKNSGNKGAANSGAESSNLFNQLMNNLTDAVAETESFGQISYTDRAQMENIVRQIADRITVMTSAEETSMEMSLNPASLGNVNVLLTSGKDGIVAKFTAQNEIVKEAVESQMVMLQQKFEEQGIKVNSIEVTIASHAFEQNLQQEDNGQASQEEASKKSKNLRRINLSELDPEEEDSMNDAEKIAAQMMAMSGNSIDFSA
ncbi:MAG: flagellar hook-length control protein FliK [Butyrivibrio sp.]|nr:flagellar hook-length control protein FliK [Butyrivibrio sp.]